MDHNLVNHNLIDNKMIEINNQIINFIKKHKIHRVGIFMNNYNNIHTGLLLSSLSKAYYYKDNKKITKISVPGYLKYTNVQLMNQLKQKFKYKIIINHIISNDPYYNIDYHSDKHNFYIDITLKTNSYKVVDSDAILFALEFLNTSKRNNKIFIHPV